MVRKTGTTEKTSIEFNRQTAERLLHADMGEHPLKKISELVEIIPLATVNRDLEEFPYHFKIQTPPPQHRRNKNEPEFHVFLVDTERFRAESIAVFTKRRPNEPLKCHDANGKSATLDRFCDVCNYLAEKMDTALQNAQDRAPKRNGHALHHQDPSGRN